MQMHAHKHFKAILIALIIMVGGFGLAYAAPNTPVTIHAMLWRDSPTGPVGRAMTLAVDSFNQANAGVYKVVPQWISPGETTAQLAAAVKSGAPDVIMGSYQELMALNSQGALASLTPALTQDQFWQARFPQGALQPFTINGNTIAVPAALQVGILYIDTADFSTALIPSPHTLGDLIVDIQDLQQRGITPMVFSNAHGTLEGLMVQQIAVREAGQGVFNSILNGKARWTNAGMLESTKILDQLIASNAFPGSSTSLSSAQALAEFENGKAAMLYSEDPALLSHFESIDSPLRGRVNVLPFPILRNNNNPGTQAWVGTPELNLAVSQSSKVKDAAIAFVKCLTAPSVQASFARMGFLPVSTDTLGLHASMPLVSDIRQATRFMPSMEIAYTDVLTPARQKAYESAVRQIFAGRDPQAVLADLDAETASAAG